MKDKISHRNKKRLARKLRTREEEKKRVPIFQTKNWEMRKKLKQDKVKKNLLTKNN